MDDDYDYEQVLQYENEIYKVNEETSESENEELTNALAQIYYSVSSNSNVANNKDVITKGEVTKPDKVDDTADKTRTNNNGDLRSRLSRKVLKQEQIHIENESSHKRKILTYDEDDYPYGGRQHCALCNGFNHDERTCENILYPDNDEATWRRYNIRESTECKRNIKVYCYNCAGNHLGQDCPHKSTNSSSSFQNVMPRREYSRRE